MNARRAVAVHNAMFTEKMFLNSLSKTFKKHLIISCTLTLVLGVWDKACLKFFLSVFWNNIWVKIMPFNKLTVLDTIEIWGTSNCLLRYIGVGFKIFHCYLISSEHIDFFYIFRPRLYNIQQGAQFVYRTNKPMLLSRLTVKWVKYIDHKKF